MLNKLDQLVAKHVMEWTNVRESGDFTCFTDVNGASDQIKGTFNPSTSDASAMALLTEMAYDGFVIVTEDLGYAESLDSSFRVTVEKLDKSCSSATCTTLPLALTLASLIAVGVSCSKLQKIAKKDHPGGVYELQDYVKKSRTRSK